MQEILIRFVVGGLVVSIFAVIGSIFKPKSFAGLFGAAPSVALATLGLTLAKKGTDYAGTEARSMIAGAIAFFAYACYVSWSMKNERIRAITVTVSAVPLWIAVAFTLWYGWLK